MDNLLFANKFRISSARLKNWDYSKSWWYFVTICTKDRVCYFGNVREGKIVLSEMGLVAKEELLKTETIRKEMKLDEWVVMPNHLHAIVM